MRLDLYCNTFAKTVRRWSALAARTAAIAGTVAALAVGVAHAWPAPLFAANEPVDLFVGSTSAQTGAPGNPVVDLDTTPVFSAIVDHGNKALDVARIQVATDPGFASVVWSSGDLDISGTAKQTRTPDLAYAGPALSADTRYFWRMQTEDVTGDTSLWSLESASFFTGPATNLLTTINTFPWMPSDGQQAVAFVPNFPTAGLTPSGANWQHLAVASPRRGTDGIGSIAWACQPQSNYLNDTVAWLHSPILDLSSAPADLELRFELWIKAQNNNDGCKVQVSTNGGTSWSDVTNPSQPYNGATGTSQVLSTTYGGSDSCWTKASGPLADSTAETTIIDLDPYNGQADVRFRFAFASNSGTHNKGPVLDSFRIVETVSGSALLQGLTQDCVIAGAGFTGATGVTFDDPLISVNSIIVNSDTQITANVTVADLAKAGDGCFTVQHGAGDIEGTVRVTYPTDLNPVTDDSEPSRNPAMGAVGVFLEHGEFTKSMTPLATRGRMLGLSWDCTYQSNTAYNGPLGAGWTGHYFQRCVVNGANNDITWYTMGGRTEVFPDKVDGSYNVPKGVYWQASRDLITGTITLRSRHGFVCEFDVTGRLQRCSDRNGNTTTCGYNTAGQLVRLNDDRGFHWEIEYYDHGRVHRVLDYVWSDTTPRVVEYVYDANGNCIQFKRPETARYNDAGGNRTTHAHTYDADHRLLTCTNPREFATAGPPYLVNTYDTSGRVIEQRFGEVGQDFFIRYPTNAITRVIDRRGLRTDCTLDLKGRMLKHHRYTKFWAVDTVAPIDHSEVTETAGKVRPAHDPDLFETKYTYNADHEIKKTTLPRGNTITRTYQGAGAGPGTNQDRRGNLIKTVHADAGLGSLPNIVIEATFEDIHQFVASTTDARGFTTTYAYDISGNRLSVTSPLITLGQPTPQQIVRYATYNAAGQFETQVDGEGNVTAYTYHATGDQGGYLQFLIEGSGELDLTTTFEWNRVGMPTGLWRPRALESGVLDDRFKESGSFNELDQAWYTASRVLRATAGATDRTESYAYFDLNGKMNQFFQEYVTHTGAEPAAPADPHDPSTFVKSTSPMTATWVETTASYSLLDYRLTSTVDAIAGPSPTQLTSAVEYDDSYNIVARVTPLGFRHEATFDERDLRHTSTRAALLPEAGTFTTIYDENANAVAWSDALGNQKDCEFDGFDRATKVIDPAGHYVTISYDASSNMLVTTAHDSSGGLLAETTRFWDEIDRPFALSQLAEDRAGGALGDGLSSTVKVFDRSHRLLSLVDDNGVTTTRSYDAANRVVAITDNVGNEIKPTYNHDSIVVRTDFLEKNPLTMADEPSHTERSVDLLNRQTAFRDQRHDAINRDTEVEFAYDGWGRTTRILDSGDTEVLHEFDLLSRPTRTTRKPSAVATGWIITDYVYDADSRRTLSRIWNDGSDQIESQDTAYGYDGRNRRTFVHLPDFDALSGDGEWTFSYDAQSNLTGWSDPLGSAVTNSFDGRNLLVGRTIARGDSVKGVTREAYDYDGLRRVTSASNFETPAGGGAERTLTVQAWVYNTLSLPEEHGQQLHDHLGNQLGSWDTGARYDALGLTTQTIYSTGRVLSHTYDGLNRLRTTTDTTGSQAIATYDYAGPSRLIKRANGNGVDTTVDYEASGCGCGGFSAKIEKIAHTRPGPAGIPAFGSERRYDTIGNVTGQRQQHQGGEGQINRYDGTYRLVDQYQGTSLGGGKLNQQSPPGATVSGFAQQRSFGLDTRGNRTAKNDRDGTGATMNDVDFKPDAQTNVYNEIDDNVLDMSSGLLYAFDQKEQLTFDPSTGLYHAYDYKGQRVCTDDDSDFSDPERWYVYDTNNRLRVEERWYEASPAHPAGATATTRPPGVPTEQCEAPKDEPLEELILEAAGGGGAPFVVGEGSAATVLGHQAISASGSSPAVTHPADAASVPSAGVGCGTGPVAQIFDDGTTVQYTWLAEDGQGSIRGQTDITGTPLIETDYTAFGEMTQFEVVYAPDSAAISALQVSAIGSDFTDVCLVTGVTPAPTPALEGHLVRLVAPGEAEAMTAVIGAVLDNGGGNYCLTVYDPDFAIRNNANLLGGHFRAFANEDPAIVALAQRVAGTDALLMELAAPPGPGVRLEDLAGGLSGLVGRRAEVVIRLGGIIQGYVTSTIIAEVDPERVVLDLAPFASGGWLPLDPAYTADYQFIEPSVSDTAGYWDPDVPPSYDGGTNETTFTAREPLPAKLVGWRLQANVNKAAGLPIKGVAGKVMRLQGNAMNLQSVTKPWAATPPPLASLADGSLKTGITPQNSRILWNGGYYLPPLVGELVDPPGAPPLGVYGAQPGPNLEGQFYFHNRIFDIKLGRWTTPDPAGMPSSNLRAYANANPIGGRDLSGLFKPRYHKAMTIASLRGKLKPSQLETVVNANVAQDTPWWPTATSTTLFLLTVGQYPLQPAPGPFSDPANHGDDDEIEATIFLMTLRWNYVTSMECTHCAHVDFLLQQYGKFLHALQDLYSHSNYVEKEDEKGGKDSERGDIPPWNMWNADNSPHRPPGVKSGAFDYPLDNAKGDSHKSMNKDDDQSPQGSKTPLWSHESFFTLAYDVAERHSAMIWPEFYDQLSDSCKKMLECCGDDDE